MNSYFIWNGWGDARFSVALLFTGEYAIEKRTGLAANSPHYGFDGSLVQAGWHPPMYKFREDGGLGGIRGQAAFGVSRGYSLTVIDRAEESGSVV